MVAILEKLLIALGPLITQLLSRLTLGRIKPSIDTKKAIEKAVKDGDTSDLEDDFRNSNS